MQPRPVMSWLILKGPKGRKVTRAMWAHRGHKGQKALQGPKVIRDRRGRKDRRALKEEDCSVDVLLIRLPHMMVAPGICEFPGADTRQRRNGRSDGRFFVGSRCPAPNYCTTLGTPARGATQQDRSALPTTSSSLLVTSASSNKKYTNSR